MSAVTSLNCLGMNTPIQANTIQAHVIIKPAFHHHIWLESILVQVVQFAGGLIIFGNESPENFTLSLSIANNFLELILIKTENIQNKTTKETFCATLKNLGKKNEHL